MYKITLTGQAKTLARIQDLQSQAPIIVANALNRTAFTVRKAEQDEMRSSFDKPTPWILKTVYVEQASPEKLVAVVGPNDYFGPVWQKILSPHVYGEKRGHKRFEARLERSGILPTGWVTVPGKHMPLDAYGNPKRGELTKMLSWLGTLEQGNLNKKSTRKNKTQKQKASYFYAYPGRSKLPPGIYKHIGNQTLLMLLFVTSASYNKRLRWFETAKSIVDRELAGKIRSEIYNAWGKP